MVNKDACQPIQNQGNCGSCTAFGTIGAWEAKIKIELGISIKLSEKDLFFCSGGLCDYGNTMEAVLNQATDVGCASETCDSYVDHDCFCGEGRCPDWASGGAKLKSWKPINSISEMKAALDVAPLVGVMDVHESFLHYQGGVYYNLGPQDPVMGGHCVTVVGYDDSIGAWLIRNSWGTGWGEEGYCWIKYGDSNIDVCMYQLELDTNPPNPNPMPSPCKLGNGVARLGNLFAKLFRRKGRFYYLNPARRKHA